MLEFFKHGKVTRMYTVKMFGVTKDYYSWLKSSHSDLFTSWNWANKIFWISTRDVIPFAVIRRPLHTVLGVVEIVWLVVGPVGIVYRAAVTPCMTLMYIIKPGYYFVSFKTYITCYLTLNLKINKNNGSISNNGACKLNNTK